MLVNTKQEGNEKKKKRKMLLFFIIWFGKGKEIERNILYIY